VFKLDQRGQAPRSIGVLLALLAAALAYSVPAKAGIFDVLFGGFFGQPQTVAPPSGGAGYASYCVRTCDGRYFPLPRTNAQQSAQICQSLCPASETKVFSGSSIDYASTADGMPYTRLVNAFAYRQKIVPGCTCNGHDAFGTAAMKLEDDPTLRPDDLVATKSGLVRYTGTPGTQFAAADSATAPPPAPVRRRTSAQATPVFPFFFPIMR
jgi:hypothetical protein